VILFVVAALVTVGALVVLYAFRSQPARWLAGGTAAAAWIIALAVTLPPPAVPPDGSVATATASPRAAAPATVAPSAQGTARPTPTPPTEVRVTSIPDLLAALEVDTVELIIVANGEYEVSPAHELAEDSLWIGARFAYRTNPVTVRAETSGGVTFLGRGSNQYGGLSFQDGAHHQTWEGFRFANMGADETGIVEVGGYEPRQSPHHITLRQITIDNSNYGGAYCADCDPRDHAVYIAHALGDGPNHLLFEDFHIDGRGGLASAFHFYHSEPGAPNASDVVVRRLRVEGTQQAIIMWDGTLRDVTFEDVEITNVLAYAVRYETTSDTWPANVVLRDVTSRGSGYGGFKSAGGREAPGLTLERSSLR
jgi:hypothetical protein